MGGGAQRTRSTSRLQVDTRSDDPAPGRSVLAAGRLAEELGFDAFFTGDHPSWQSEVWLHMAALAGTTERIGLGPMVTSVLYRPPVLTARLAADLDHLSNGRLVLGLGIGWDAAALGWGTNEFDRMGLPYPTTRERQEALAEAIAIIRGVWGPEPFSFQGRHFTAKDAQVAPPPTAGRAADRHCRGRRANAAASRRAGGCLQYRTGRHRRRRHAGAGTRQAGRAAPSLRRSWAPLREHPPFALHHLADPR